MELKDLILETLNEFSTNDTPQEHNLTQLQIINPSESKIAPITPSQLSTIQRLHQSNESLREECEFLELLQERLLVLFEGLNAPQNKDTQSRLNITINFLEYQLSVIQERLNDLKK